MGNATGMAASQAEDFCDVCASRYRRSKLGGDDDFFFCTARKTTTIDHDENRPPFDEETGNGSARGHHRVKHRAHDTARCELEFYDVHASCNPCATCRQGKAGQADKATTTMIAPISESRRNDAGDERGASGRGALRGLSIDASAVTHLPPCVGISVGDVDHIGMRVVVGVRGFLLLLLLSLSLSLGSSYRMCDAGSTVMDGSACERGAMCVIVRVVVRVGKIISRCAPPVVCVCVCVCVFACLTCLLTCFSALDDDEVPENDAPQDGGWADAAVEQQRINEEKQSSASKRINERTVQPAMRQTKRWNFPTCLCQAIAFCNPMAWSACSESASEGGFFFGGEGARTTA